MAANRLRTTASISSESSGMPVTPQGEGNDSDSDGVPSSIHHNAGEDVTPSPKPVQRSDQPGAHGARMDVGNTPEELQARAQEAKEEAAELEALSKRTNAVEI